MTGDAWLHHVAERVNPQLARHFPEDGEPPRPLYEALRYALTAPGKRFRPALVLASARWLAIAEDQVMPLALAVEMMHTYSLVHDDLPAMDNDDLRRGRPTVHRAFSEDIAILVGDALLTEAFFVLTQCPFAPSDVLNSVRYLARTGGHRGLVGGQVRDLTYQDADGIVGLEEMHRAKTGALIIAASALPAVLTGDGERQAILEAYGAAVGLAFQITDDILDVMGDQARMGKAQGRDARQGKTTYVSLYGVEGAERLAQRELAKAVDLVNGPAGDALSALARFVVDRDR